MDYESLPAWPLQAIENDSLPYSERVTKNVSGGMPVSVSDSLMRMDCLSSLSYRLGSRSALEWIVDQYQVKGDSDPNREDDPHYIVLLVGQVVRVSVETSRILKTLPRLF